MRHAAHASVIASSTAMSTDRDTTRSASPSAFAMATANSATPATSPAIPIARRGIGSVTSHQPPATARNKPDDPDEQAVAVAEQDHDDRRGEHERARERNQRGESPAQ